MAFDPPKRFFTEANVTPDDVTRPGFVKKVRERCPASCAQARAVLTNPKARGIYLRLGCGGKVRDALDLPPGAVSPEAVKAAIRKLQMKVHPDRWSTDNPEIADFAKQSSQRVNGWATAHAEGTLLINSHGGNESEAEEVNGDVDSDAERREFFDDDDKGRKKKKRKRGGGPASVKLSLCELIRGVYPCKVQLPNGGSLLLRVPPGTVPGWRTTIKPPGMPPVEVVVKVRPETMRHFSVDDKKRLRVDVDVSMVMAFCGRGSVTADNPAGVNHAAEICEPLEEGGELAFGGGGFGGEAMVGVVHIINDQVSPQLRDRVWKLFKEG